MSLPSSILNINRKLFAMPLLRQGFWILLYTLAVTAVLYAGFSHWAYDDPFITYRYARNLSSGLGFVYNPGERVLSTTTPFFTLLLALLSSVWKDLPHLANLIGALSLALGGILLWDLARSWETPAAGWAGLLFYPTFPLLITTLGSETPLYLAFCLAAFAFYARLRYSWAAVFSALAILTRPDGLLVPALLGVDYFVNHLFLKEQANRNPSGFQASASGLAVLQTNHRLKPRLQNLFSDIPWKPVLLFLGLILPWFIFAWGYFGSPLPVTLAAKQHQGAMEISQRFAAGFLSMVQGYAARWYFWPAFALALLGILTWVWQARRWTLFFSWIVVYFTAYSLLGVSRYYWYYAPLVPGFVALIGLGVAAVSGQRPAISDQVPAGRFRLFRLVAVALATIFLIGQGSDLWQLRQHPDHRVEFYRAVGKWLRENTPIGARVATLEAGVIGYYAQRPMIDFAGLLQPDVAAQLTPQTTYIDAANWAVEHYRPEYLVLQEGYFTGIEQDFAARNCEIVQRFPGQPYGTDTHLNIYACWP